MRTTLRIDDDLYRRTKERAAATGRSVGDMVEDALRAVLAAPAASERPVSPLPVFGGSGTLPGIDLSSNAAPLDAMEEGLPLDARR